MWITDDTLTAIEMTTKGRSKAAVKKTIRKRVATSNYERWQLRTHDNIVNESRSRYTEDDHRHEI